MEQQAPSITREPLGEPQVPRSIRRKLARKLLPFERASAAAMCLGQMLHGRSSQGNRPRSPPPRSSRIEPLQHLAPFAETALGEQLVDESARLIDRHEPALGP
jgi:hypothetical protein